MRTQVHAPHRRTARPSSHLSAVGGACRCRTAPRHTFFSGLFPRARWAVVRGALSPRAAVGRLHHRGCVHLTVTRHAAPGNTPLWQHLQFSLTFGNPACLESCCSAHLHHSAEISCSKRRAERFRWWALRSVSDALCRYDRSTRDAVAAPSISRDQFYHEDLTRLQAIWSAVSRGYRSGGLYSCLEVI